MKCLSTTRLILLPCLSPAQAPSHLAPTSKVCYKEVGDSKLDLWIWKPTGWKTTDQRSAMVFFHGGGWSGGSPSAFARQSAALAARGMVAISVQYRLTKQPSVTVETCIQDARSAMRWVRQHAAELGIHPEKIAAGGGSAGGHLAASLATLHAFNDPQDDSSVYSPTNWTSLVTIAPRLSVTEKNQVLASGGGLAAVIR